MKFKVLIFTVFITIPLFAGDLSMLINPERLSKIFNNKNLIIIDARSKFSYIKGHIKNAINLDGSCSGELVYKKGDIPCVLKSEDKIKKILSEKGICKNKKIVIYGDENSWGEEGRIFWLLDKLGYKYLSILNGGYTLWKSKGYPTSFGISLFNHIKKCKNLECTYLKLIDAKEIFNLIRKKEVYIIDTRTEKEYNGAILYGEKRGGHIPTSINIWWKEFLNKDYTLKPRKEIIKILKKHGIPEPDKIEKKIITVCTGGVRSGFVYFVLKYAGYRDVENYDNGFWEWAASNFPVEK